MDWRNAPIGMIRYDELLNALLAIWKTQQFASTRNNLDEFSHGFQVGFEEGLDAIAQIAGVSEAFEASKAIYRTKIKARFDSRVDVIDGHVIYGEK
jgi:hypothetical protein